MHYHEAGEIEITKVTSAIYSRIKTQKNWTGIDFNSIEEWCFAYDENDVQAIVVEYSISIEHATNNFGISTRLN